MKKECVKFLIVVLLIGSVYAGFELGAPSHSVDEYYGPGNDIKGWVNMSFNQELANSLFEDSFENQITLVELLESNDNLQYSCVPVDCGTEYATTNNGATEKTFSLDISGSKLIGLKVQGNVESITSVDFVVESDAGKSCYNQLKIDVGADGVIETGNAKSSTETCDFLRDYGCFDEEETPRDYIIGDSPNKKYCQKINLSESAGFNIGAEIARNGDSRIVKMALYDLDGEPIETGGCDLPGGEGEVYCSVDYLVTEISPYYVCVYSDEAGVSRIKGYEEVGGCGFYGAGIQAGNAAYKIFSEGRKFNDVGVLNISNSIAHGNTLAGEINDYLMEKYGGMACSEGCVIPINILSKSDQSVTLNNLEMKYKTASGEISENKFYEINETYAKVNSTHQKISLNNAGFATPLEYGNYTFSLDFNGEELFSKNVHVENVPQIKYLFPTKTSSAFPTLFRVTTDSQVSVKEYKWEFGDNSSEKTSKNAVTHVYASTGAYTLKLTLKDNSERVSSKEFIIIVVSPKELLAEKLEIMQADIGNVTAQINSMPVFYKQALKSVLDMDDISEKFKQIQRDYNAATTEEDYNAIVGRFLELEVPKKLLTNEKATSLLFYPKRENINLDVLKTVGGGDYELDKESEYKEAILLWQQKNIDLKISLVEISAVYETSSGVLTRIYQIDLKEKEELGKDPYVIIKKSEGLAFKENYLEQEEGDYFIIELSQPEQVIEFSTVEDFEFFELPLFVSTSLARIKLQEPIKEALMKMNWKAVIIVIIVIFILGFVVYVVLQEWYKRKYENWLFKERNDLYNLIFYTKNSKDQGLDNKQILQKLKKMSWSSEQIKYIIRKYLGKRTGMIEIPIMKLVDKIRGLIPKKKVVEESIIPTRKI
ncbi:MAG: PKD domain-containing protein [archaeon]